MSNDNFDSVFFRKATKNGVVKLPQLSEIDKDFGGPLPHDKPAVKIQKQKGRIEKFIESFVKSGTKLGD